MFQTLAEHNRANSRLRKNRLQIFGAATPRLVLVQAKWGGYGVNINTSPSDQGAKWFPENEIQNAYSFGQGAWTKFTYNPQSERLTVEFVE